tara:strand:- start:1228 stop:1548 length:321 start_codon:yes stop_codon:yes gene_type:complete
MPTLRISLLITMRTKLTPEVISVIPPDCIFFSGFGEKVRFWCYKTFGDKWQVAYKQDNRLMFSLSEEPVILTDIKLIKKLVPCNAGALKLYNYGKTTTLQLERLNR